VERPYMVELDVKIEAQDLYDYMLMHNYNSPTFTILQIYESGRMPFYHFDVYRISDVEEMDEIGYEDCFYGEGVSLVEWADLIPEILPEHYTQIVIEKDLAKGFEHRRITIEEK